MDIELHAPLRGSKLKLWQEFLRKLELEPDLSVEETVLITENDAIIAAGSRLGNLLKCIGVDPARQGEGLTATLLTALRQEAFRAGHRHLFLYTKPANEFLFSSLFFYPVARTDKVLLMEDQKSGIDDFLHSLPKAKAEGVIGSAVMNCNPFTFGHQYLIETAARECDHLYIFVLSEDQSRFSAKDRMEMVKAGCAHLSNVTVLPTGPYLISAATFPTYFLKERDKAGEAQCRLDIEIFLKHFAPHFSITRRYLGQEPLSLLTNQYNELLKEHLPARGIEVREIPRLTHEETPISASEVRTLMDQGNWDAIKHLVPTTTYQHLKGGL